MKSIAQNLFKSTITKIQLQKLSQKAKQISRQKFILFGISSSIISYHFIKQQENNIINCFDDVILRKAQNVIDSHIYKLKKQWGPQITVYPTVNYDTRGNKYTINFLVDQRKCDLFSVLATALDAFEREKGEIGFVIKDLSTIKEGDIITITAKFQESKGKVKNKLVTSGTIYISGEMTNERPNFKFILEKEEEISATDLKAFTNAYQEAVRPQTKVNQYGVQDNFNKFNNVSKSFSGNSDAVDPQEMDAQKQQQERQEAFKKLEEFGVTIFMPQDMGGNLDWNYLAGYESQKRDIEDTVLLALSHPEIFENITKGTRMTVEPNKPKAVLFEGPPGTGKTTSAKIIAQQVDIPLIYMPLESIMSKYYGESEKRFADVWDACKIIGKSIVFIDEIDAIASARNDQMHEGSKRILSTLLRKIDSFESSTDVLLIAATNRKQDLDEAMLSRIDLSVKFQLPDKISRVAIFQRYAKQLDQKQLEKLADLSVNMSGRNISDVCKDAERRWASKIIRKEVNSDLPNLEQYIETLKNRKSQNLA